MKLTQERLCLLETVRPEICLVDGFNKCDP